MQLHKAWLEKRAAAKATTNSEKTAYFRRVIKFKNKNEPLDNNNISFVPDFESIQNRDNFLEKKYIENDVLSSDEKIDFLTTTEYQTTESSIDNTSQTTEEFIPTTDIFLSSSTSGVTTTTERSNEIITTTAPKRKKRPYFRRQHLYVKKTNNWGPWSGWNDCSRECGTGVKSQTRECFSRQYVYIF